MEPGCGIFVLTHLLQQYGHFRSFGHSGACFGVPRGETGEQALVTVELRIISRMTVERLTPSFSATDPRVESGFSDISNSISALSRYLRCFICFRFLSVPRPEGR